MANDLYTDLVNGATASITPMGATITSKTIVENVAGANGNQKLYNAISATGHYIGEQNLVYTDSYLQSIDAVALTPTIIEVSCSYEPMTNVPAEINIGSRTSSAQTNKDKDDNAIEVSYTYATGYKDADRAGTTDTVGKTVEKQSPSVVLNYKVREIETGQNLIDRVVAYLAKLNEASWNLRPSDAAGTWLVTVLDSTLAGYVWQAGALKTVYDVTYAFESRYEGWDTEVVYTADDGNPPDPATWGEDTQKTYTLYANANLSNLGLT